MSEPVDAGMPLFDQGDLLESPPLRANRAGPGEKSVSILEPELLFEFTSQAREVRSLHPIARFVDGRAAGWVFDVGPCFREALDLQWVEITRKGKKYRVESQGRAFNFLPGSLFNVGGGALGDTHLSVQIDEASSAGLIPDTTFETLDPGPVQVRGSKSADHENARLLVRRVKYDPGHVKFSVYGPLDAPVEKSDEDGNTWTETQEKVVELKTNQADFVTLLQTGRLISKEGVIDLVKEYGHKEVLGNEA